jgi:hypothetical protein
MPNLYVSMRAEEAATLFERLAMAARDADGNDGAFEERVAAFANTPGAPAVVVIFNNDDMEREDMDDTILVEWCD